MAIPLVGAGIAAAKKAGAAVAGKVASTGAYKTAMNVVNHPVTQVAGAASILPFGAEANIDYEKKWMDAAKRVAQSRNKGSRV